MPLRPLARRLATSAGHHPFIVGALGTLLTLIVLAISALTLWANRETAIEHANETSRNVAAVLASHISRTVESADQSLLMLIAALNKPGIRQLDPEVQHDLLFSQTASARYVTGMGVTDDKGRLVDGCCSSTHHWDFSDRDYFIVHRDHANLGLYISAVYKARSRAGVEAIALSRRMNRADGTFAGTALVAIDLDYFKQLLGKLDVGPRGITAIVRTDGTLVARNPPPGAARALISKHARRRGDLAARYGGEEFVVLLPDTDAAGARQIAEAIRAEVEGTRAGTGNTGLAPFTVSIGCATARRASFASPDALTKAADDALYEAKRKGRNRVDCATVA